jgi:hypothetical protein
VVAVLLHADPMSSDDVTLAVAGEPVAGERAFPSWLPAPGTGDGRLATFQLVDPDRRKEFPL